MRITELTFKQACLAGLAAVTIAGLAGCASTDPMPVFRDVRQDVAERTGKEIHWDRGTAEDRAVDQRVRTMLGQPLTADRAVRVALLRNQDLQATYEDLGIAQAELVSAGLLSNPVLSADVKFAEGGGAIVEGAIAQNFLDILYMPLRKAVARAELTGAKRRVTGEVLGLSGEVRRAFVRYQADRQLVEMMEKVAQATGASLDAARRLRAAGNIPELEVDRERALAAQARIDLSTARQSAAGSHAELSRLMGLWGEDADWSAAGRLPEIPDGSMDDANLVSKAVARSAKLAADRAQAEALARQVGLSGISAVLEELSLGAAGEREVHGGWTVGPSGSVSLPVFNFGQAASAKAKARLRQALRRYAQHAVTVRSTARSTAVVLRASRQRARYFREELMPAQARIVAQSQLQYNAMQIGVFQLLQAKRDQIAAGRRFIQAARDYWLARADMAQILAGGRPEHAGGMTPMPGAATAPMIAEH